MQGKENPISTAATEGSKLSQEQAKRLEISVVLQELTETAIAIVGIIEQHALKKEPFSNEMRTQSITELLKPLQRLVDLISTEPSMDQGEAGGRIDTIANCVYLFNKLNAPIDIHIPGREHIKSADKPAQNSADLVNQISDLRLIILAAITDLVDHPDSSAIKDAVPITVLPLLRRFLADTAVIPSQSQPEASERIQIIALAIMTLIKTGSVLTLTASNPQPLRTMVDPNHGNEKQDKEGEYLEVKTYNVFVERERYIMITFNNGGDRFLVAVLLRFVDLLDPENARKEGSNYLIRITPELPDPNSALGKGFKEHFIKLSETQIAEIRENYQKIYNELVEKFKPKP